MFGAQHACIVLQSHFDIQNSTIAANLYKLQMAFTHETTKATSGMHAALADYVSTYLRIAYLNKLCSAQGSDLALM